MVPPTPTPAGTQRQPESVRSRKRRHAHLFKDDDVRRWYENVGRGSNVTADIYLRRLGSFCTTHRTTPKDIASLDDQALHNLLLDFVTNAEKQGYAGSYIQSTLKALRSWLAHNRREIKTRIKVRGAQDTPTLKDERVPTPDELKRILLSGEKKTRTACVLVAHAGLRLETLGNYTGDDGLRVRDLPEMIVGSGGVGFEKTPTMLVVRKPLSKARHQYFTFLGEEGCSYLKDYLDERIRQGEKLTKDSAIVTPKLGRKPFITAINIGDAIRQAIRSAGFPWRPYVLRSYFDTQLMLAESKGLILRDYRSFWMGHKGDIEARYTTNKYVLPQNVIEDMRDSYRRSQDYLETTGIKTSQDKLKESLRRELLLAVGLKEEEIDAKSLAQTSNEELQSIVRQKLLGEMVNNGATQKVVSLDEVEKHIADGWEFVASLPNGKAILKLPR